ncbi:ABC transporter permease [Olivibacter sitiensis]|uniref:ABC transporter permease n=1 Tax=Olivibacter sitiensis TaxID=376470 RepID=UPI000488778D|nr:ABC transporter permease [Olivibacter sitiensis]
MIKNYIKIAWRNLVRHKKTSTINILGLAIGIAASLLLFVIVQFEWSYDKFQTNYRTVYRVVTEDRYENDVDYNKGVAFPTPEALKLDMPELKRIVPVFNQNGQVNVLKEGSDRPEKFHEDMVLFTTDEFFDLFDAKWLAGNPHSLTAPGNVVLDRTTATKYFGNWQKAVNQSIKFANVLTLKVSGIVEDAPKNSNFPLAMLISFNSLKAEGLPFEYNPTNWNTTSSDFQTYVLMDEHADRAKMDRQLAAFSKKHFEGLGVSKKIHHFQPLAEMHFDERYTPLDDKLTRKSTLQTLSIVGIFIIIMASINFVNLSTAQAVGKSKEIGIRKVLGSNRMYLIFQSFGETFLTVLLATLLAIAIAYATFPFIDQIANIPSETHLLQASSLLFLLLTLLVITLLSGLYPALVISGFKPILALKNKMHVAQIGGVSLRRGLVVVQFAIAQLLMVGTLVAVKQMTYIREADLGFNKEAIYYVNVPSDDKANKRMDVFKQRLLQVPAVKSVSLATDVPSSDNKWSSNFYFDHSNEDIPFPTFLKFADADYFDNYQLQFITGQGYRESDTLRDAIINETMAKKLLLKSPEDALGKTIRIGSGPWLTITGVVKDFVPNSLKEEIKPIIISSRKELYQLAGIKLDKSAGAKTLDGIKSIYDDLYPQDIYNANFLDESIANFYKEDNQLAKVYKIFALLAIVISCIGLYGLVSFMAEQKVREIGIRKVLGASISSIVYLLSREFIFMVLIAFVVATPIAYYLMTGWLENFNYRISIGAGLFVVVIVISMAIAMITIGFKAIKAAVANPVDSLRDE